MPLDQFQHKILQALLPQRSPDSVFAGGTVLQRHGHRLSQDQDIFTATGSQEFLTIVYRDVKALEAAGVTVDLNILFEGMAEAIVNIEDEGASKVQWVQASSFNFFGPVADPEYGWRLHMADLAINKVLAAAGRREVRDYVDLALIDAHIMPLWLAIWAAPGKDASQTPNKILERIARTNQFTQVEFDNQIDSLCDLSAGEVGAAVRDAIDTARDVFPLLPQASAGQLFIGPEGEIPMTVEETLSGRFIPTAPADGGAWPSGPAIDAALLQRLIDEFGENGSRLTGTDPGCGKR
ncbi:hypothetical protein [Bosea sp. ANAM02]|uniref:hypothetical protein n=1 Tax=Bosea sp. ANAM02 TaxID=2020412 RepID=UPI00140F42C8|nr:hypothetical protein [Bosea sp. ANAM02]BCB21992.1 hypothetical protein OCUBac02_48860 [Bosea sp. ANAM02]